MSDLATFIRIPAQERFLGEEDLRLLRQAAEEIDAAYGETLDSILPGALARLSQSSRAA